MTAANFLNFMVALNRIFIQDLAAMMIQHPERATHPVFHMERFRTEEFQVSCCVSLIVLVDCRIKF
jgi:2-iminoacetate synthase ThiH